MRIKSYFASTVEGALSEARRELGPEAILIESRRSATESRRLGAYEVVCALAAPKPGAPGTAARPGQEPAAEQDGIPPSQGLRSSGPAAGRTSEQLSHLNDSISAFLDRLDGLTRQLRGAESSALRLIAAGKSSDSTMATRDCSPNRVTNCSIPSDAPGSCNLAARFSERPIADILSRRSEREIASNSIPKLSRRPSKRSPISVSARSLRLAEMVP